jgi:hypothetical protein
MRQPYYMDPYLALIIRDLASPNHSTLAKIGCLREQTDAIFISLRDH